jgi:hypothetical protein
VSSLTAGPCRNAPLALIRAAQITLRRAILQNLPPGKERAEAFGMACGLM